jgi:lysylphosphatidylglycerol synthetase-like protein (DUF2156 family)
MENANACLTAKLLVSRHGQHRHGKRNFSATSRLLPMSFDHQMAFLLALPLPPNVLVWASFRTSNVVPSCLFQVAAGGGWLANHVITPAGANRVLAFSNLHTMPRPSDVTAKFETLQASRLKI